MHSPAAEAGGCLIKLVRLRLVKEGDLRNLFPQDGCCRPSAALAQELGIGVGRGEDHSHWLCELQNQLIALVQEVINLHLNVLPEGELGIEQGQEVVLHELSSRPHPLIILRAQGEVEVAEGPLASLGRRT